MRYLLTVLGTCSLVVGCQSGLYKISTSEDGKSQDDKMQYYEIDNFAGIQNLKTGDVYDPQRMPVEVSAKKVDYHPDEPGLSGVLWLFSLGLFPIVETSYETQELTITTPLGEKTGSYRIDAKNWGGWLPIFIGYPGSADERPVNAKLPNRDIERKARDMLVSSLCKQFSYEEYVAYAKKANDERKEVTRQVNECLSQHDYAKAHTLIKKASITPDGGRKRDVSTWKTLEERVSSSEQEFARKVKAEEFEKAKSEIMTYLNRCDFNAARVVLAKARAGKSQDDVMSLGDLEKMVDDTERVTMVDKLIAAGNIDEIVRICKIEKREGGQNEQVIDAFIAKCGCYAGIETLLKKHADVLLDRQMREIASKYPNAKQLAVEAINQRFIARELLKFNNAKETDGEAYRRDEVVLDGRQVEKHKMIVNCSNENIREIPIKSFLGFEFGRTIEELNHINRDQHLFVGKISESGWVPLAKPFRKFECVFLRFTEDTEQLYGITLSTSLDANAKDVKEKEMLPDDRRAEYEYVKSLFTKKYGGTHWKGKKRLPGYFLHDDHVEVNNLEDGYGICSYGVQIEIVYGCYWDRAKSRVALLRHKAAMLRRSEMEKKNNSEDDANRL